MEAQAGRANLDTSMETRIKSAAMTPWRPLEPQGTFAENYTLVQMIGDGAFGEIWRAFDIRDPDRHVAIKVFHPSLPITAEEMPQAALRFYEGAIQMKRLAANPHVVDIVEGPDIHRAGDSEYVWFAMPLLKCDLDQLLRRSPLSTKEKLNLVEDVVSGLSAAHQLGIRHRDVRPKNILIEDRDGRQRAVLADFDIAYYEAMLVRRDATSTWKGDPRYIPHDIYAHPRGSDEDRDRVRVLLREYDVDTYALSVVILDVFSGIGVKLPLTNLVEGLQQILQKAKKDGDKDFTAALASRIGRVCSAGLLEHPNRFKNAKSWVAAWNDVRIRPRIAMAFALLSLAAGLAATAIAADWTLFALPRTTWKHIGATGIGSLVSIAATLGTFKSLRKKIATESVVHFFDRFSTRKRYVAALLLSSLVVLVVSIVGTDLKGRLNSFWIEDGDDCQISRKTGSDKPVAVEGNKLQEFRHSPSEWRIDCPADAKIRVLKGSWLTDSPKLGQLQKPRPVPPPDEPKPIPDRLDLVPPPTEMALWEQLLTAEMKRDDEFERYVNELMRTLPVKTKEVDRIVAQLQGERRRAAVDLQGVLRRKSQALPVDASAPVYRNAQWRALFGHSAVAILLCGDGLFAIGEALHHNGHSNAQLWIADAIRCLGSDDGFQAVVRLSQSVALSPMEREIYYGTLAWVANSREQALEKRGLRLRAISVLNLMRVQWDAQRAEVLIDFSSTIANCSEAMELLASARKYLAPAQVSVVEGNLRRPRGERRKCATLGWR